jgi:integrase
MASLSSDRNGHRVIQFTRSGQGRGTLRLGQVSLAKARKVHGHIEELIAAKRMQQSVEERTAGWVSDLDDDLHSKLAAFGLVSPRGSRIKSELGGYLDSYVASRIDVKPATRLTWQQAIRNLADHFGSARDIATIHEGDADSFKLYLQSQDLSSVTVFKRLQICRMLFRAAMRQKLIQSNPFADVSAKAVPRQERFYFVTREETERILEACNPTWRVIVALARFGGLRCPSEVLSVKWSDVSWDVGRLVVTAPKTEHHPGKGERVIPLFPELRRELEQAYALANPGDDYIIDPRYREAAMGPRGWQNCNLRTQFQRIMKRAGCAPWPRLFHALRSSRETELANEYPLHVVTAWLGNTPKIAMKHYLMVTDGDFERAAKSAAALGGRASWGAANIDDAESSEVLDSRACVELQRSTKSKGGDDRN